MKHALGIDVGGTTIKCSLVYENGKLGEKVILPVVKGEEASLTLNKLFDLVSPLLDNGDKDFIGIGIGCPGMINSKKGTCDDATNLGWHNVDLKRAFEDRFHVSAFVENDANAALLGEATFGVGKEYRHMVFLTLGTGVGSGLFLNGKIYSGNEGKGAELGHMSIDFHGRQCACGRKGCLECYASATALTADAKLAMAEHKESLLWNICKDLDSCDPASVFEAEKQGDKTAKEVVDNYVRYLGEGCLNLCNIFRPEAILLGGGVAKQGENLSSRVQSYLSERNYGLLGLNVPSTKVLVSSLGSDAGIYGAAALAFIANREWQKAVK